jgi:rfaE bifunctional protein kinase chain/domain
MTALQILDGIRHLNILVVGDICLDRWCWYDPATSEPSRETGIPRLGVVRSELTPGAGGTIANNLVALGAGKVTVLGVVGEDGFGWELLRALGSRNIAPDLLIVTAAVNTFTYTKLLNAETGEEDRPRVDFINTEPLPGDVEKQMIGRLQDSFPTADVIVVSDQAETSAGGVITPRVRERVNQLAAAFPDKVVWVDSRMRSEFFRSVVLKPNESEAAEACKRSFGGVDLQRLFNECELRSLIVTHGGSGAEVINESGSHWVPGRKVNAIDVCGAGDSFSAGAACALSLSGADTEAAWFGNLVASITVTKKGTGTASREEVLLAADGMTR